MKDINQIGKMLQYGEKTLIAQAAGVSNPTVTKIFKGQPVKTEMVAKVVKAARDVVKKRISQTNKILTISNQLTQIQSAEQQR